MIEKIEFQQYANCLRLSNGEIDAVVSTDFGPRILFYGFTGGENVLGLHPDAKVDTELGEWRPYGGHRLWIAPENMPLSYVPDNAPIELFVENDLAARFVQPFDEASKTQKEIAVTLSKTGSDATITHRITNRGNEPIELSAWALTIMRGGGEAIVPNEPSKPYAAENLLPVRSMALWSYTDFTDPRWRFEKNFVGLKTDESLDAPQKFGVLNKQGWAAYKRENLLFVKRFDFVETAAYPDMNSNTEVYTAGTFIEVETLSPLKKLNPDESIVYTEKWNLFENASVDSLFEK